MRKNLKVLMVFPEIAPFVRTGLVGDIGGILPKVLKDLGNDVRVVSPQYHVINERKYILRDVIRLRDIEIPLGRESVKINVKSAFVPNSKVQVYFVNYRPFFSKNGLYKDARRGGYFKDNDKRFILFSKSVMETLIRLQWQPDIVHCHDWQTGLIPFFLRYLYNKDDFFNNISSVFTVYDSNFQGSFPSECLSYMGLNGDFEYNDKILNNKGECSFLKAGIVNADVVTTIDRKIGEKFISPLNFHTIRNGIDYNIWSPEKDRFIVQHYNNNDLKGKEKNKRYILEKNGLKLHQDFPLISIIDSLMGREGFELVTSILDEIIKEDIYLMIFGASDKKIYQKLMNIQKANPEKMVIGPSLDNKLMHNVIAGSDFLLIPAIPEKDGLRSFIGLKYGTIPLIGIGDKENGIFGKLDMDSGNAFEFLFEKMNGKNLLETLRRALNSYRDKKFWSRFVKNTMQEDFSWQIVAKEYLELYESCAGSKNTSDS